MKSDIIILYYYNDYVRFWDIDRNILSTAFKEYVNCCNIIYDVTAHNTTLGKEDLKHFKERYPEFFI